LEEGHESNADGSTRTETKSGGKNLPIKPNHNNYEHEGIEVLESKQYDEIKENDLIANSGQTLSDDHDEAVSQVLAMEENDG